MREEIGRADSKAAVLVGALGITSGTFSAFLAGRSWSPDRLSPVPAAVWWCGLGALALSLLALLAAVLPRVRSTGVRPGAPLAWFGDIRQAARHGTLRAALEATEREPLAALLPALTATSAIAERKHQWIRTGLLAFCAGSLLLPLSVLLA
nr:Pycsar system effector family protein [Streptomyces sp. GZWMJZ-114]